MPPLGTPTYSYILAHRYYFSYQPKVCRQYPFFFCFLDYNVDIVYDPRPRPVVSIRPANSIIFRRIVPRNLGETRYPITL